MEGFESAKARDFAAQRTQQQTEEGDFGPLAIIGLVAAAEAVLLYFWLGS